MGKQPWFPASCPGLNQFMDAFRCCGCQISKPSKPLSEAKGPFKAATTELFTTLRDAHTKNSHTNGCVWKSIAYHLAYHKNGEPHAKICCFLHGNPMGKIRISTHDLELWDVGVGWYSHIVKSWGESCLQGFGECMSSFWPRPNKFPSLGGDEFWPHIIHIVTLRHVKKTSTLMLKKSRPLLMKS